MNWRANPAPATPTSSCPSFSRSWCGRCSPHESGPMRHGLSGPGRRSLTRSKLRRIEGWRKIAAVLTKGQGGDRKSTRLNSSHGYISYAVFCLKKKKEGGIVVDRGKLEVRVQSSATG